jgi:hypothetical protein
MASISYAGGCYFLTTTQGNEETGYTSSVTKIGCLSVFSQVSQVALDLSVQVAKVIRAPRDPNCMVGAEARGAAFGTALGATAGLLGFAFGGVGEVATVPAFGSGGGLLGGGLGGLAGLATCSVNNGSSSGGSRGGGEDGRASGSDARLTKPQQRQTAKYLGMKEVKSMMSQGQPVFEKDGRYFSFSNTSHTAG